MPKQSLGGVILDEVPQIDIAFLRECGYMKPNQRAGGTISWATGPSIRIEVDMITRFVAFTGGAEDTTRLVCLEARRSNLGKGLVWFFICPATRKRCRKLYGINDRFLSRHAFPSAMYRSQAESKRDRGLRRYITLAGTTKNPKLVWDLFNRKLYRAYYNGKPTKRYLAYLERKRKIEHVVRSGI